MTKDGLARVLREAFPALQSLGQPWCVIGSAALIIAKVPVADCPDLDILTTTTGALFLEEAWSTRRQGQYVPDPHSPFQSRFSRCQFADGAVEVMGDLRFKGVPVSVQELAAAPFEGLVVPIPTLAEQARLLRLFARPKDAARLGLIGRVPD